MKSVYEAGFMSATRAAARPQAWFAFRRPGIEEQSSHRRNDISEPMPPLQSIKYRIPMVHGGRQLQLKELGIDPAASRAEANCLGKGSEVTIGTNTY